MDAWIFAAAAGAGYVARQLKNLSRDRQNLSAVSPRSCKVLKSEPTLVLQRNQGSETVSADTEMNDILLSDEEVASTSGLDDEQQLNLINSVNCTFPSMTTLSPRSLSNDHSLWAHGGVRLNGDHGDVFDDFVGVDYSCSSSRKRSALRTRRGLPQLIRPLNSLERCLMAQLYNEHAETEEYIHNSFSSPSLSIARPFYVTNGNTIINIANGNGFRRQETCSLYKGRHSIGNTSILGVPPLPDIRFPECSGLKKCKVQKNCGEGMRKSRKMVNRKCLKPLTGSSQGAQLFCLGISVGIISSLFANKREVEKLKELLKKNEYLVQDLQEELDMKHSLTVKELPTEGYESQETREDPFNDGALVAFSLSGEHENFHEKNAVEESFSQIGAELEAELARLEMNINSSSLEAKLSDIIELDPDFAPDIVQGELRADMLERDAGNHSYTDGEKSGSSTTHSANYAVSPRELSIRLYEIMQSRLEERVNELETALQSSRRKLKFMESRQTISLGELPDVEARFSSLCGSPTALEEHYPLDDQPVVINLSGDALDAYKEAYEEFSKMNRTGENSSQGVGKDRDDDHDELDASDYQNIGWMQNSGVSHDEGESIIDGRDARRTTTTTVHHEKGSSLWEVEESTDGSEEEDDEMDKLLIKQLIEKTRKGSPVVLNAQRELYSGN